MYGDTNLFRHFRLREHYQGRLKAHNNCMNEPKIDAMIHDWRKQLDINKGQNMSGSNHEVIKQTASITDTTEPPKSMSIPKQREVKSTNTLDP